MATKTERMQAERVSAAIGRLTSDPELRLEEFEPADARILETAQHLARLPELLGPVDPALEQRVMRQVQAGLEQVRTRQRFRMGWAVAGLVAVLLVAMFLTPLGQTAVASFMAVFNLGRTEVRITPVDSPSVPLTTAVAEGSIIRESLTLEEAQTQVPFALPQPTYLPPVYRLSKVESHTYPDLPPWISQPLFAELIYEGQEGEKLVLRVYPITLGDEASISGLNLQAAPIQDVQDVDVNGQPGVFLQLGADWTEGGWKEIVWEYEDLVLALSSVNLTESELLRIARSIR